MCVFVVQQLFVTSSNVHPRCGAFRGRYVCFSWSTATCNPRKRKYCSLPPCQNTRVLCPSKVKTRPAGQRLKRLSAVTPQLTAQAYGILTMDKTSTANLLSALKNLVNRTACSDNLGCSSWKQEYSEQVRLWYKHPTFTYTILCIYIHTWVYVCCWI